MRRRFFFAYLPAVLVLVLTGVLAWLLHTESGVRWAWGRLVAASPGELYAESVGGDVRAGMVVKGLRFSGEGLVIQSPTVRMKLDFDLLPPAMSIEQFDADRLSIQNTSSPTDYARQRSRTPLPDSLALPFPVRFRQVHIGELRLLDPQQQMLFSADELTLSGSLYKTLNISQASTRAAGADWQLSGEIGLDAPFAVDLVATTTVDATHPPMPAMEAHAAFTGNLDQIDVNAQLSEPAVNLKGRISDVLDRPNFDVNLSAEALQWPPDATVPDLVLRDTDVRIVGGLEEYSLKATAILNVIDLPQMAVQMEGSGNPDGLEVANLGVAGELVDLIATGTVAWGDTFRVALDAAIARLAPDHWIAEWPRDQALHGRVAVEWAGERVQFTDIDLAAGTSGFTFTGSGELDPERELVEAELAWSGFRWPLTARAGAQMNAQPAAFSSEEGQLTLNGTPSDWRASGTLRLQAGTWPTGQIHLSGEGDSESARIEIVRGEALGGTFEGNANYRWTGTQTWSTELRVSNLDLSAFGNGLPEAIGGELSAKGQLETMAFDVNLKNIRGHLRGQPLQADGGISYEGNDFQARNLDIRSGVSTLSLDGNPERPEGLRFSAHIADLGAFLADAGGTLEAQGLLSVDEARPRLELEATGADLAYGEWQIGRLSVTEAEHSTGEVGLQLDIADLAFGERKMQEISLATAGENLFDRIRLHARRDATQWDAELRGDASHWPQLLASAWQQQEAVGPEGSWRGDIESWRIEEEELGWLQLEAAAPLSVTAKEFVFGPACLRGPRDGRICLDARLEDQVSTQANMRLDAISLSLLSFLTGSKLQFTQTLTGDIRWHKAREELAKAEVAIDISAGEISFPEGEKPLVTGPGRFAFHVSDGQLLAGNLDLEIPEAGIIDSNFSVPDISQGADSPVEGRIRIALRDIGPLLVWVPQIDVADGSLEADVVLAGSVVEPLFTGHAALVRGYLESKATGTVLRDIQLAGAVYQFHHAEMNGSFRAGEGHGQLKANLRFDDFFRPEITLDLTGKELALLNVPDLRVTADPDLHFNWHDSLLTLDGEIVIPRAQLSPRYLPTATVSESPDLVIVAGALPPEEKSAFDRSRLRLTGSVGVTLGDDVAITLDRATAKLSGKTMFSWNNSLIPIADGHYTVRGKITAYGQLLEITEGRIAFPKIPADNPHLSIRAEREIYGNVQVRKAGVLLSGTLRRPSLETYTTPQTTAERALTLLVTGHDFDYEQGVGGVEVGMYIAPKLYVSYGIGLFENQSVISARYEIKGGFGVKATSGQRETGADVSYTIEN